MKLPVMTQKYTKHEIHNFLSDAEKYITNLCETFDVPETVDGMYYAIVRTFYLLFYLLSS